MKFKATFAVLFPNDLVQLRPLQKCTKNEGRIIKFLSFGYLLVLGYLVLKIVPPNNEKELLPRIISFV
ncbi:hypothetical protein BC349_11695 [Flavihumibacter stibioxidans]|uniref:Uncharacterized protein n=1 Tax=Flavihumibacter stibioxidans TaxID=1834163 RepID=A0ABR7M9K6_9BACT|nr:hypothetical protein [Flavihumibacter stibioxidans]